VHEKLASLVGVVSSLVDRLESSEFPYALGGAIALSAWSDPRATTDVDITIWASGDDLRRAFDVLRDAGVSIDSERAEGDVRERGMFVGRHGPYRVDVFTPSIPFYDEVRKHRRRIRIADRDAWVLAPESLAVFKMLFFRAKDLVDVARMIEVLGDGIDRGYVRRSLVEIVGPDDARTREWERIVEALDSA
jgi:hypothetical protein